MTKPSATRKPTTHVVEIKASQLRNLLAPVIPLAATARDLPLLNAVLIQSADTGHLTARATDRYVLGIQRLTLDAPAPAGLSALVPLRAVKTILAIFRPTRDNDPDLVLTFGSGTVEVASAGALDGLEAASSVMTFYLLDGSYPPIANLVAAHKAAPGEHLALNPSKLAQFVPAQKQGEPMVMHPASNSGAVLVTIGDDFVGLIQPVRGGDCAIPAWVAALAGSVKAA